MSDEKDDEKGLDFSKLVRLAKDDPKVLRIKKAAREGRLGYAGTGSVESLQPWVDKVMDALGIEAVFISDESRMSDFGGNLTEVSETLGFPIDRGDSVVSVARKLRDRGDG